MDFISWLVVGALFMLAEFGVGKFYLFAIGLACAYPAFAAYTDASVATQLTTAGLGGSVHALVVMIIRKLRPSPSAMPTDVGQRVEVIEWNSDGTAKVRYEGKVWDADKAEGEMPDADHGIIKDVQYGRLVISTGTPVKEATQSSINLPD